MDEFRERVASRERQIEPEERASHLAFVAHEIRNPLSTALWSAELLARLSAEERGGPRGEKLARMSLRALSRLRRIVEDHLLAARLDAGGVPVEPEAVPARDLLPAAGFIDAPSVEASVEPGLTVVADPALARRVVEGVMLAAARGGAAVRVTATRAGGMVRFRIEGALAGPETLDDPGRGHPGDARGAALSLGVARRASLLLGGGLRVEGGGWIVELPAAEPPAAGRR
jgi:signal transduction histidine kinase